MTNRLTYHGQFLNFSKDHRETYKKKTKFPWSNWCGLLVTVTYPYCVDTLTFAITWDKIPFSQLSFLFLCFLSRWNSGFTDTKPKEKENKLFRWTLISALNVEHQQQSTLNNISPAVWMILNVFFFPNISHHFCIRATLHYKTTIRILFNFFKHKMLRSQIWCLFRFYFVRANAIDLKIIWNQKKNSLHSNVLTSTAKNWGTKSHQPKQRRQYSLSWE